jgi:hypothetical protein
MKFFLFFIVKDPLEQFDVISLFSSFKFLLNVLFNNLTLFLLVSHLFLFFFIHITFKEYIFANKYIKLFNTFNIYF